MSEHVIDRLGHLGDGIARGPVYAPGALPGERVTGTLEGNVLREMRIVAPSEAFRFAGDDLTATAIVSADSVATLVPGREQVVGGVRVDAPADLAGGWATRIEPPLVGVAISLETRSQSMTIPRMPVWVQLPPSELGRWRIEIEPRRQKR